MGYSRQELEIVQERWQLRFPPDLVDLLRSHRPLLDGRGAFDWVLSDPADIPVKLDWPFEGFLFDIEHSGVWWPEWGQKPENLRAQRERLRHVFADVPTSEARP